ncbi:phosphate ABC transporter substrate-binding protein [Thioalkalivibrio denitrificans]|uniref:Phosphate ABC transporter substrate-binding protein n=1 Tax=Thioalkalivibrio denitrificans TaxID=108003 RepID=A0A1V3NEK9_9GAMM|nr:phosphate ABC transporter substrate-binding protein [Thioalkalivibrio denitrificans]OOG23491.1 phosphate ABC transporter substrate-binding protein [Thioalkalivibrio denitrificans]
MFRKLLAVLMLGLMANLAHAESTLTWAGCGISRNAFMDELSAAFKEQTGITIEVVGSGATQGIRQPSAGISDMGGTCRLPLPNEPAEALAHLEPVAWDALVVIVHKDTPVDNITLEQVRDLFLGRITNWNQLGGPDQPMEVFARQGKISGVGRMVRHLVYANFDQEFTATRFFPSSGPLERAVEETPWSIGITGISSAQRRDLKILNLDGMEPSYDNIRTGAYTLYRPLYIAYDPSNPKADQIQDFVRFVGSREGREVIRRNGCVPYTDALALIMKQLDQERRARDMGVYN